jgi:hypothetical protein
MLHGSEPTSTLEVNTATAVNNTISRADKVIRLNALITLVDDPAVIAALNFELATIKQAVEAVINRAIELDGRVFAASAA